MLYTCVTYILLYISKLLYIYIIIRFEAIEANLVIVPSRRNSIVTLLGFKLPLCNTLQKNQLYVIQVEKE